MGFVIDPSACSASLCPEPPAVLRMRGLPFTATHEDIKQFFEGYQLAEGGDNPIEVEQKSDRKLVPKFKLQIVSSKS